MQFTLEIGYKNFQFIMIINVYALFLRKKVYKNYYSTIDYLNFLWTIYNLFIYIPSHCRNKYQNF